MRYPKRGEIYQIPLGNSVRNVVVISADWLNASRDTVIVALVLVEIQALRLPTVLAIPDGEDIEGQIRLDDLWVVPAENVLAGTPLGGLSRQAMDLIAQPLMATFDLVPPPLTTQP